MGIVALIILAVAAIAIGVIVQFTGDPRFGYEWLMTAVGAFVGGFVATSYLGTLGAWGPALDGMFVLPAMIGAVVVAAIVAVVARLTGEATTA
jgi:uncharacterized membrane protein YeaQ/YmgE (transglycosylase-associated protein family)